jgi:tetratricopeptide (TPR) repeat protein
MDEDLEKNDLGQEDTTEQAEQNYDNYDFEQEDIPQPVKLHIPVWVYALLIVIVALDLISLIQFPTVVSEYKIYKTAKSRIEAGETSKAITELLEVAENHTDSLPVLVKLVDLSMENGYYDIAGYIIDSYLEGESVSDEEYDKLNGYFTKLDNYYTSSTAVEEVFTAAPNQDTLDEEYYNYVRTHLEALLHTEGKDDAYLCYTLSMVSADTETSKDYLQQCYEIDPECFDVRAQLGVVYRRLGDLEKARFYTEEALSKDNSDLSALRSMATIVLVEGDLEGGLIFAEEAYNSDPEGLYVRETYLIALTVNNKGKEAQVIQDEMAAVEEYLAEDTLQLLNGEISLEDYYIGE